MYTVSSFCNLITFELDRVSVAKAFVDPISNPISSDTLFVSENMKIGWIEELPETENEYLPVSAPDDTGTDTVYVQLFGDMLLRSPCNVVLKLDRL
jgi:hypothetical protein